MNDDEPISQWYFMARPVRYVKNSQTGEIKMQIKDWSAEFGYFLWRDMTDQEREVWIKMSIPPTKGK